MKSTNLFLSTVLAIAFTLPMFGQDTHSAKTKTDKKKHDMSSMMGKPTVNAIVEGLHMKVWLMTQKQHKKMMKRKMGHMMMGEDMKGMKHDGMGANDTSMGMDKATMDAMMAGTHHIMLDVTDSASRKEIANASAKVMIVSPSKKHSSVDLKPMMSHFGSALTLDEKGKYDIVVNVSVNGVLRTKAFQYSVK